MIKYANDIAIAKRVRQRHKLRLRRDELYAQRRELDKQIAACMRQLRRMEDKEIAKEYATTMTRVRKAWEAA